MPPGTAVSGKTVADWNDDQFHLMKLIQTRLGKLRRYQELSHSAKRGTVRDAQAQSLSLVSARA